MHFPALIPGRLIQRKNRFTAEVQVAQGEISTAYVPTTGRLTGVLKPGCRVWLSQAHNPARRTAYTLLLAELQQGGLCSVNAALANTVFAEAVATGQLAAFPFTHLEKEVTYGHSRLDFRLSSPAAICWVEVKSVTYVENGVGMFPDAPTVRGQRHLEALAELAAGGDQASAAFIVQRGDAHQFAPFEAVDPAFATTLRRVHQQGVAIHAYRCDVSLGGIKIEEEIPVFI